MGLTPASGGNFAEIERMFHPRSIAVVGVSATGNLYGSGMVTGLRMFGYSGAIYAVHPKGGEYEGRPVYRSVEEIPEEKIDFAIICVAAGRVPEALEACRRKGAAAAEILSAGFREVATAEGIALEEEIRAIAARGIRVVGPNCFGIYCPRGGLTLLPGPDLSRKPGPVAFLAQSGGMAIDFTATGRWMGLDFSKVVSFGNAADLRETELLAYLGRDPQTGVIAMYMEGLADGDGFVATLKEVAQAKPVVVYKGGLSAAGQRAVASHTASLGGSRVIWESVLRQCNAVQVQGMWDMAQTCLAFAQLPIRPYRGIAVVGGGGALGVAACDAAEENDLVLPVLRADLQEKILAVLPKPGSSAGNPVDVASPMIDPAMLKEVLTQAAQDERIDVQVLIQLIYHYKHLATRMGVKNVKDIVPYLALADVVKEVVAATGKPVITVLPNQKRDLEYMDVEEMIREARDAFLARGIPVYDDLDAALRALGRVARYAARRNGANGGAPLH
jgi:acyl-CoA synthetase (NDP forming)